MENFTTKLYKKIKSGGITCDQLCAIYRLISKKSITPNLKTSIEELCTKIINDELSQKEFNKLLKEHGVNF